MGIWKFHVKSVFRDSESTSRKCIPELNIPMYVSAGVGDGAESLHVKVMEVRVNSKARKLGVTTSMYLKSLSLSSGDSFGSPVFIGGEAYRKTSAIRQDSSAQELRPVDLEKLISLVDGVLTSVFVNNQGVKVNLVYYKN